MGDLIGKTQRLHADGYTVSACFGPVIRLLVIPHSYPMRRWCFSHCADKESRLEVKEPVQHLTGKSETRGQVSPGLVRPAPLSQ